jgi:hypothetical protein
MIFNTIIIIVIIVSPKTLHSRSYRGTLLSVFVSLQHVVTSSATESGVNRSSVCTYYNIMQWISSFARYAEQMGPRIMRII